MKTFSQINIIILKTNFQIKKKIVPKIYSKPKGTLVTLDIEFSREKKLFKFSVKIY